MADNLSGLNLATRTGEGGANIMSWGNLDRAANQLYQEQKQREARGYNDYLQGQQSLQKEFANVRSADIPDVVNDYNNVKKVKQSILFDDKIKNNPVLLAQKQQEANIAEAQLRQKIAASNQLMESDKQINARKLSHPDEFDADLVKQHAIDLNLPLTERIKQGRLDATPYLYKGGDSTKLMPLVKQAVGTQKAVPIGEETPTADGFGYERKHILRTNNPVQYASTMYKGMQTNKLGQYASAELNKITPQQIATITSKFNNIPDAEFEQKWGVKKSDLTSGVLPDDKAGQYVMLDAMQYAVNNLPTATDSRYRDNKAATYEYSAGEWDRRSAKTQERKQSNIILNNNKKPIETVDFLKKGIDVVSTKDNPSINDYFSAWKSNQEKDSEGNNIGFLGMKVHPAGTVIEGSKMKKPSKSDVIEVKYADKIPLGGGLSASEIKTEYLDPSEITLSKLASLNKKFLGSDNKVEKGVQTESVNRANSVSSPKSSEPKKASGIVWKNK